jgi:hypothetical protein
VRPIALLVALVAVPASAWASDRHFTYTHETDVLPAGQIELEPWTTFRIGKPDWFFEIDQRVELELGLGHRLQTSFYLNFATAKFGDGHGNFATETSFDSVSWELKGKLSDPVADAIGSALYLETTAGPGEVELEGKLLLDKQVGNCLLAFNLVSESELELEGDGVHPEEKIELDLGASGKLSQHVSLGLEVHQHNIIEAEDGEERMQLLHSALFVGPTVAWRGKAWWGALTVMPQVVRTGGPDVGKLDLEEYENTQVRLLLGVHL